MPKLMAFYFIKTEFSEKKFNKKIQTWKNATQRQDNIQQQQKTRQNSK